MLKYRLYRRQIRESVLSHEFDLGQLAGKTVLISGAADPVGSSLMDTFSIFLELYDADYTVCCTDSDTDLLASMRPVLKKKNKDPYIKILTKEQVREMIKTEKIDLYFHADTGVSPLEYFEGSELPEKTVICRPAPEFCPDVPHYENDIEEYIKRSGSRGLWYVAEYTRIIGCVMPSYMSDEKDALNKALSGIQPDAADDGAKHQYTFQHDATIGIYLVSLRGEPYSTYRIETAGEDFMASAAEIASLAYELAQRYPWIVSGEKTYELIKVWKGCGIDSLRWYPDKTIRYMVGDTLSGNRDREIETDRYPQ